MLAVGNDSGHVYLLCIKTSNGKSKIVQKFDVPKHCSQDSKVETDQKAVDVDWSTVGGIACLEWCSLSPLAENDKTWEVAPQRLAVAFKGGVVVFVSFSYNGAGVFKRDIEMKEMQVLYHAEDTITQMAFKHQFLLLSCFEKTLILNLAPVPLPSIPSTDTTPLFQVHTVGTKSRNDQGCARVEVLSARKSGHVWVAETKSGRVNKTFVFELPWHWNEFNPFTTTIKRAEDENLGNGEPRKPETVKQLGVLLPFGRWVLSYTHPLLDGSNRLNHWGLKVLHVDESMQPSVIQWYPLLGRIIDCAVHESLRTFFVLFQKHPNHPTRDDVDPSTNLTSPTAVSMVCLAKVSFVEPVTAVQMLLKF
ncbi:hypothetical protein RFI_21558 [Reticulomyxa filosa]|uniref:Uncharacterized protein n=1 Tax=Reticulomyxa filosa TaxID=46433 RepID=X6MQ80_RETFI|nr:hypothetical protein RFI_21558 [Reticulomyxa filosa]|eukprot:ETO15806.1 hypothetical protein RFI_21558 [Reticulomyxa filosa]